MSPGVRSSGMKRKVAVTAVLTVFLLTCVTLTFSVWPVPRDNASVGLGVGSDLRPTPVQTGLIDIAPYIPAAPWRQDSGTVTHNTEEYGRLEQNTFLPVNRNPLSTISIDVDTASYSNMRRFVRDSTMPPNDAVRIEEFINYFNYDYAEPPGQQPFSVTAELAQCPWKPTNQLLHIGLQARSISVGDLPRNNLVFLLDVSGSMDSPDKLPLLKRGFQMLAQQLRPTDQVAIVVYAGAAGLVLDTTSGSEKAQINAAIESLDSGGSTAGGEGIELAYEIARKSFLEDGNNRVILATDGDFNVGASSEGELISLIEREREHGIFLTVLGFGTGNLKDSKMEQIADHGNGNYAYIDNLLEARRVLIEEMGGTLVTVAKDVKLQLEFNPARIRAYRLIGYENRMLRAEDFKDDTKDAGELGAGHTVTALYELIPADAETETAEVDELKYQETRVRDAARIGAEAITVKLRYKEPDGAESRLLTETVDWAPLPLAESSDNFRFSAAVASFGMLLRGSTYRGTSTYEQTAALADAARGEDSDGRRSEFVHLVKTARGLASVVASN
jgi:Ca-activated chloride channel homolog